MSKFDRILDIDYDNRTLTAQPGVTNLALSEAGGGAWLLLRPGPIEPGGMFHRGQCGGKFRGRALS